MFGCVIGLKEKYTWSFIADTIIGSWGGSNHKSANRANFHFEWDEHSDKLVFMVNYKCGCGNIRAPSFISTLQLQLICQVLCTFKTLLNSWNIRYHMVDSINLWSTFHEQRPNKWIKIWYGTLQEYARWKQSSPFSLCHMVRRWDSTAAIKHLIENYEDKKMSVQPNYTNQRNIKRIVQINWKCCTSIWL